MEKVPFFFFLTRVEESNSFLLASLVPRALLKCHGQIANPPSSPCLPLPAKSARDLSLGIFQTFPHPPSPHRQDEGQLNGTSSHLFPVPFARLDRARMTTFQSFALAFFLLLPLLLLLRVLLLVH